MSFWKDILKELKWVKENIKFSIGDVSKIRFWTHHGCGSSTLKALFENAANKDTTVAEVFFFFF